MKVLLVTGGVTVPEETVPDGVLETTELFSFEEVTSDELCPLDEPSIEESTDEILLEDSAEETELSVDIILELSVTDWLSDELPTEAIVLLESLELFLNVSGLKIPTIPTVAMHIIMIIEIIVAIISYFKLLPLEFSKITFLSSRLRG